MRSGLFLLSIQETRFNRHIGYLQISGILQMFYCRVNSTANTICKQSLIALFNTVTGIFRLREFDCGATPPDR